MTANLHEEEIIQAQLERIATVGQKANLAAAMTAYQNARADGLCRDGAWECALQTLRATDIKSQSVKRSDAR